MFQCPMHANKKKSSFEEQQSDVKHSTEMNLKLTLTVSERPNQVYECTLIAMSD